MHIAFNGKNDRLIEKKKTQAHVKKVGIVCTPPPFCRGGELNLLPNFQEGGGA